MLRTVLSIRKDDQVQVIAGREKGKTGKVLRVYPKSHRVLIEKVNMVKRHVKPTQQTPQGGIVEKELALPISNVLLFCPKCNRGVRQGSQFSSENKAKGASKKTASPSKKKSLSKIRICRRCKQSLEFR